MSISTSMSSSRAVTSSGLSSDVIRLPERLASQVFLEWSVPWQLPVLKSCQARCWKRLPYAVTNLFGDKIPCSLNGLAAPYGLGENQSLRAWYFLLQLGWYKNAYP
ncbi:hypothetical protein Tco_1407340 [Tanacetum coccineum]